MESFNKEEEEEEEGTGNAPFHLFAKNTKQTCALMCISLFIIIFLTVLKINSIWSKVLLGTGAALLFYCFYKNIKETGHLYNSSKDDTDIRNNIILSYVFSGFLFLFIVYVLYSMIF